MTEELIYDAKDDILYSEVRGKVDFESMIEKAESLGKMTGLPKKLKILEDAWDSVPLFKISDIPALMKNLESQLDRFDSVRHAVLHSDPTSTAFTLMADHFRKSHKYRIRVFSTIIAAKEWLERDN
ncbi:MAG: hypothetical protein WCK92_14815 [Bacteroidota bacterium]